MTRFVSSCVCILLLPAIAWTQSAMIEGRIVDKVKRVPLSGVILTLTGRADSTIRVQTATDTTGHFVFRNVQPLSYRLVASYLGYEPLNRTIEVSAADVDLGTLAMSEAAIPLTEVVIEGRIPPAVQKGDTTEYNAGAFKMSKDATAEDLVTKMPGVMVENGTVKAQGENVQQVLVDGRPFFGADPTLALRNLPSEIIDKVQVFDKLSDQAQLTGFDDGQSAKTMNIVTSRERRQGQFGRFSGGYGTDDRYTAGGNLNSFQSDRRLSVIGLSNNINQPNFSMQDLLGVSGGGNQRGGFSEGGMFGRGRRGGQGPDGPRAGPGPSPGGGGGNVNNFLVGQQSGITSAHSLGLNYADSVGGKVYITGSYFFNLTENDNPQNLRRQYILSPDSISLYTEEGDSRRNNNNHRLNLRAEYSADSSNSFIITPQLYFQNNRSASSLTGKNSSATAFLLSKSENSTGATTDGYTSQNHVLYRHRFAMPGRTISADIGFGANRKQSSSGLHSLNTFFDAAGSVQDTVFQQSAIRTDGYSLSSSLVYTEPLGTNGQLQLNYNPTYARTTSENRTYNFNPVTADYTDLNTRLSNTFENAYLTNSAGVGYRLRGQSFNATAGVSYQVARLSGEESYPLVSTTEKTFYTLLPNVMLNYEFAARQNLRVFYRTSTASPTVTQLQNVVDNTNPLLLSVGNPDLRQSYSQTILTRLTLANTESARSLLFFLYISFVRDYIGNSTIIPQQDTILAGGFHLNQGTQLTMPVNQDGNWNSRSLITYGLPLDFLKSNLNFNAGVTYARTPGLINGMRSISNSFAINPGFVLSSNVSEDLDFTVSYTAGVNIARNSVQSNTDNNYFTHNGGLRLSWVFWQGFVYKSDINNVLYSGLSGGLDQNSFLWNVSLGKKLFEDQRGELLFTVYDLLNQNRNVSRSVTETYVEDTSTRVLSRYFMLTFSYNLQKFREARPEM